MNQNIKDFNDLIARASQYLASQLSYAPSTVGEYRKIWKQIRAYMASNEITSYGQNVKDQILRQHLGTRSIRELSYDEKRFYNGVHMLFEFQQSGKINLPPRPRKAPLVFGGILGKTILDFLEYKRMEERLSKTRLDCYRRHLFGFLTYCHKHQITSINEVGLSIILCYLGQLDPRSTPVYLAISTLRGFMKYAFEQNLIAVDYAKKIPRYKTVNQPKLPSTYSKEEIEKLIASVVRSSACGKRNYAMILLAARLGLRASDISRLRFESLHWESSTIHFRQFKTGKDLTLPLLTDVGNAVIDYLKYCRPASDEPYVFLTERPPYGPFPSGNMVTHVVQRAFKKAGINTQGRKFGAHALRHTLAFRMLEESTVLPVISEVLGHESTESTRYYLRIDLKSMQQCILDVPVVAAGFYEQKGGAFYE